MRRKHGKQATDAKKPSPLEPQTATENKSTRHADNYGVEVIGFDSIEGLVLSGELLLIMEHLAAEIAADNY